MLDRIPWCVRVIVYFVQDINKFVKSIRPSAVLIHLGALVELECGLFGDMVTDIHINGLGEPEVTGIILYREFILAAEHYN